MIILKVTKTQLFTLSLEDTFFGKPQYTFGELLQYLNWPSLNKSENEKVQGVIYTD